MIKVMVVDDSAVIRQTLSDIIDSNKKMKVVAVAHDPFVAAEKLKNIVPDVIVLDIEMPRMDGLTFLEKLMSQHPLPVVICSSVSTRGSDTALTALDLGAIDIITKPEIGSKQFLQDSAMLICDVIEAAAQVQVTPRVPVKKVAPKFNADIIIKSHPRSKALPKTSDRVIVIGASTGGTEAITKILQAMPSNCPGILVVQHMPEKFTTSFAKRLNEICSISVEEASHNDRVLRGQALIAPGNQHMLLKRSGAQYHVQLQQGPMVSRHRPSIDVLFRSCAIYAGGNISAALLTGMGADGAQGLLELRNSGARTCAQDEKTSVVFGMPKEAIKLDAAEFVLPLENIGRFLLE